jgi:2-oxoglutarate ferredoxin oxidoreductase subunit delta
MKHSYRVAINAEHCKACGLCIEFCPQDVLGFASTRNDAGFYPAEVQDQASCIGCLRCAMMCPDACIEIWRLVLADDRAAAAESVTR